MVSWAWMVCPHYLSLRFFFGSISISHISLFLYFKLTRLIQFPGHLPLLCPLPGPLFPPGLHMAPSLLFFRSLFKGLP